MSRAKITRSRCTRGVANAPSHSAGALVPVSPTRSARAAAPCKNASGNDPRTAAETPSASSPVAVIATLTQASGLLSHCAAVVMTRFSSRRAIGRSQQPRPEVR